MQSNLSMKIIFWLSLAFIFYTFFGYGILLFILVKLKKFFSGKRKLADNEGKWPTLTVIVAAYNEERFISDKINNTLALLYPKDKIHHIFITDGSTDRTAAIVSQHSEIELLHSLKRGGKIAAIHRAMDKVNSEIVIFTDANTFLNKDALFNICRHYTDPLTGAVAGEKRMQVNQRDNAAAGEGFYWRYESKLKAWDSELNTTVGAAGELFSVRTKLYSPVGSDTILDDFMISMLIAQKGYRIVYEPEAFATESGSENIAEELKRKIRIAAGGIQSVIRLKGLLNPFHYPILSFQYISHRVLRWTVTPFLMVFALILNVIIVYSQSEIIFKIMLMLQVMFYTFSVAGWLLEKKEIRVKILFIPYYFVMMNYAVAAGIQRYFFGEQNAAWEKSKRK